MLSVGSNLTTVDAEVGVTQVIGHTARKLRKEARPACCYKASIKGKH